METAIDTIGAQRALNYRKGDGLDVTIEKIVPRGFGLGFAENLTVFVPLAAPGDVLRVRIRDKKKRMAFAEIESVVRPGPNRIVPPCPHFGVCGGCDLQQLDYRTQLEAKRAIVRDCLVRIGKIDVGDDDISIIGSPQEFAYRSRARWHLDRPNQRIGYMRRESNEVVDVAVCPVLTPEMQSTLTSVRESVEWSSISGQLFEMEATTGDDDGVSTFSRAATGPAAVVSAEVAGHKYSYSAETFFQTNRSVLEKLIEGAIGGAKGELALDLYSGVGLFAVLLAKRFGRVVAVEGSRAAAQFAATNVEEAGLANVELFNQGVEKYLARSRNVQPDFVLLDPPRSGPEPQTIQLIAEMRPSRISYVSCEPSVLARDLRMLLDAGYAIQSITALDLFPQTHHVETVVHLSRA